MPSPAEAERLRELRALDLLDQGPEPRLDRITRLAATIFEVPIALVSLVDEERLWFASSEGVDFPETRREASFCAECISAEDPLIVEQAEADPRFAQSSLVAGEAGIRFYAGKTVFGPGGQALGTLCVLDSRPRGFSERETWILTRLAEEVEDQIWERVERAHLRREWEMEAEHDAVTGLLNHRGLVRQLDRWVMPGGREVSGLRILAFHLELGDLRTIEQLMGHASSGPVLREMAGRLRRNLPNSAILARIDDLQFVGALSGRGDTDWMADVLVPLKEALENPVHSGGQEMRLRVTIGASLYPENARHPQFLLDQASATLGEATFSEPASIRFFDPARASARTTEGYLESQLRRNLAGDLPGLSLVFQPQVELETRRWVGCEALVRFEDPKLGTIDPNRFLPLAQRAGLLKAVEEWVFLAALGQIRAWQDAGMSACCVSVNLTSDRLIDPDFPDWLQTCLRDHSIDPGGLVLEVTEETAVRDPRLARANALRLRASGIRLALDDFGTGYCGLAQLQQLPVDILKLDRSLVQGTMGATGMPELLGTAARLAEGLGMQVVAEGVEREEQALELGRLGLSFGQGMLFGHPMAAEDFQTRWNERSSGDTR